MSNRTPFDVLHDLERTIEQEWTALRERLSRDLQATIADLRQGREARPPLTGAPGAWPIEGVLRLHDELRQSGDANAAVPPGQPGPAAAEPPAVPPPKPAPLLPEASSALASRVASLEREVSVGKEETTQATDRNERQRKNWVVAFAVLAVGVVVAVALAIGFQRGVTRRLNDAASRVAAAERQAAVATDIANRQVTATRENAERQIGEARQSARQAQTVSDVLAAPDLVRFNLTTGGPSATRSFGQLLWSRSRGLVFSGSRVPAAAAGSVYQLWLLTGTVPVSVGLLTPDPVGRVTMVTDDPPRVPRPVTGVSVTLEPAGGRPEPSGPTVMARLPIVSTTPEAEPPPSR